MEERQQLIALYLKKEAEHNDLQQKVKNSNL
jgi:hypothetical protein